MELTTFYYAQIDAARIVFAVSQLAAPVQAPDMIAIESYDDTLIGKRHDLDSGSFEAVVPPELPEDERLFWVDVGPFKDRLGMDIGAIASSTHSACLGVREFLLGRLYVDLRDPKVELLMDVLIVNNQPVHDPVWPGSGPMTPEKKAAILTTPTAEYERHIKGLGA